MQYNNQSIAKELRNIFQDISKLDKKNTQQALTLIRKTYNTIDGLGQENDISVLRAIVHWMTLNIEMDFHNESHIHNLLLNGCYSKWVGVLADLLDKNDPALLPTLHQSLTSPNWIVRPSPLLLKNVATWLSEIKSVNNFDSETKTIEDSEKNNDTNNDEKTNVINHQVSEQTEHDLDLIDAQLVDVSIDEIISSQISKAEENNKENLHTNNVFEEIDIDKLQKEYVSDDLIDVVDFIEAEETESSDNGDIENQLIDSEILIDQELLAENETLVESLVNNDANSKKELSIDNLENELNEIYNALVKVSFSSTEIGSSKDEYIKHLDNLASLTEKSSLKAVIPIAYWCQNNISLFSDNPSSEINSFVHDGLAWSWIKQLAECLSNNDKNSCINDISTALTQKEWLNPIDTKELEDLLINLKNILIQQNVENNKSELEADSLKQDSLESFDMPQLIDTSSGDDETESDIEPKTSGFQVTWDDETHPELLMVYLEETPEQISELVTLLNKIKESESNKEEKEIAARLAHTIKGGSAIVGITALSEFTYRLETLLDYSKNNELETTILNTLPATGKCLESLFDAVQTQQQEPQEFFELFKTLDAYVESLDTDPEKLEVSNQTQLPDFIVQQNASELNEDKPVQVDELTQDEIIEVNINETTDYQLNWNDDVHPELLMVYLEETPEQITTIVSLMQKISDGAAHAEEKHTASRMAHTIKGGSALVGVTALSEFAYRLETILDFSVKNSLSDKISSLLPKAGNCLEALFEALQMQDAIPEKYHHIFKQLDSYVDYINESHQDDDLTEDLTTPDLPDFIVNQNKTDENSKLNESKEKVAVNQNVDDEQVISSLMVETGELEKLNTEEDITNITSEIENIVMNLINISSASDLIKNKLEDYESELQRFELLTEISGYPELSSLSQWCQTNLSLFAENNDSKILKFVNSGEVWSWIEYVGAALNNPEDMSHLSSLSAELMRQNWINPIDMDDLQTILLALRNIENSRINVEEVVYNENNTNKDEIISWDKDIHPELLAVYLQETPDQISEVSELLHKISKGESSTEDSKKASRIAHTIKGASGVVGLSSLVQLTHSLEDILDHSIDDEISTETSDLLAEASDCMESLFETIQNKQAAPEELNSILERLSKFSTSTVDISLNSTIDDETTEDEVQSKLSIQTLSPTPLVNNSDEIKASHQTDTNVDVNEAHIRVPVRIIDKLLNLAGELVTTSSQVSDDLAKSLETNKTIKSQDDRVHNMLAELTNTISQQEKDQYKMLSNLEKSDFDSLEMDSYNELHSVASLLSESFLDGQEIDDTLNKQLNDLSEKLRSLDKLNKDFSDVILRSRMVSINTIIPRLERIVRQTCRKTNKKAQLLVTGNHINIDTDILNGLVDPLLHMLRNSIDHGIESPEDRVRADKDETGTIELSFTRDGNNILMSLTDDGAGINPETIYQKALEKELITSEQKLSEKDTLKLILTPGFSTQEKITDISGRGVGMDVVNTSVEELNGTMALESNVGEGTKFKLTIPLTLITNTTLLVKAANNIVALPIDTIEQIIYQEANNVITRGDKHFVLYNEEELEIHSLGHLLSWSNQAIDYSQSANILIIKASNKMQAIHVDSIISSREVVVKPLNPWISVDKGVIGACHLNDGGVAPVINLATVAKNAKSEGKLTTSKNSDTSLDSASRITPKILVVDDSLSNRKALSLIIDKTEYDVVTAVDGMDALQTMNENNIDLVFTDLEMPRMNGIELTQAIRAWNSKSKTPIVMITSRTTNKHRELAVKAGVDDYLTKPVVTETLLHSINKWLDVKTEVEA